MCTQQPVDLIGIGIGPFNLGLAVLSAGLPLSTMFFDQSPGFNWHPGLLLDEATLQVPFYADLVTLADPCNPYSFLAYLKSIGRLLRFAISENPNIRRKEYNRYCQWVVSRIPNLKFHHQVRQVRFDLASGHYLVDIADLDKGCLNTYASRRLVLGVGTSPFLPACKGQLKHEMVLHSEDYLCCKEKLLQKNHITLIGSGQSAAEIFFDLLPYARNFAGGLHWFTKSPRWFSMERSKLCFEMTSPQYIEYFFSLDPREKSRLLAGQDGLYKGINERLISDIYDLMYRMTIEQSSLNVQIRAECELREITQEPGDTFRLGFYHQSKQHRFSFSTEALIFATGYRYEVPKFIDPVRDRICFDEQGLYAVHGNYSVDINGGEIFVQNAEIHTHGFNAPDLGMGPYRNACILNEILGYPHFHMDGEPTFQSFGLPDSK